MRRLQCVNERTTAYLQLSFLDRNGLPEAPSSISYRIDDPDTGEEIRADTALTPAAEVEITLLPSEQEVLFSSASAKRRVTVSATYGAADEVHDEFTYVVRNLAAIP